MTLTEAQQELCDVMSDASEFAYFASWMDGTEFRLWTFLVDATDRGEWGREILPPTLRDELRSLSKRVGGWIYFRESRDIRSGEDGCAFIETADWQVMYEAEMARRSRGLD